MLQALDSMGLSSNLRSNAGQLVNLQKVVHPL